jgi:SAM-dependent methyltransferase
MLDVADFYDRLAGDYHLIYADWQEALRRQSEVLAGLIRAELGEGSWRVLDCTSGIGTQALGLALLGYQVTASDISPAAVARSAAEAGALGVELATAVADVRALSSVLPGPFDAVLSCDNSLPHLLGAEDVRRAVAEMGAVVRSGGLVLIGIRDYEPLLRERPRATVPQLRDTAEGRWVYFQVWDWSADGQQYTMHLFILRESHGGWETRHASTRYRPLRRAELEEALRSAGLAEIRWHEPEQTGHHQPLITARRL